MMTITFAESFQRTDAGRAEIKAHAVPMSRPARNLLMVIDASCSAQKWVAKVQGSSEADLALLLAAGLIVPSSVAPARAVVAPQGPTLEEAVAKWSFSALYTLLTYEARERFGLIKGYRLILEIERCSGPAEMHAMAIRFVEQLRTTHGEDFAVRFKKQLVAGPQAKA